MPDPTFVGSSTIFTNAGSAVISPHASTQTGDLLLAWVYQNSGELAVAPSGWTASYPVTESGGGQNHVVFTRTRQAGDSSYTFTRATGSVISVVLLTYRASGGVLANSVTGTPGGNVTSAEGLLLIGAWSFSAAITGPPSGFTTRLSNAPSPGAYEYKEAIADRSVSAGVTSTAWGSGPFFNWALLLTASLQPPVANFSISSAQVFDNQTVSFTDTSTSDPDTWIWERKLSSSNTWTQFSTSQNPSSVAFTAGTWDVRLTASNAAGEDSETKTGVLVVLPVALQTATLASLGLLYHAQGETNAAASVTVPSGSTTAAITYSFSGSLTSSTLTVQEVQAGTSNVVATTLVHAISSTSGQFPLVLTAKPGLDLKITLGAGGSNTVGRITVQTRALG